MWMKETVKGVAGPSGSTMAETEGVMDSYCVVCGNFNSKASSHLQRRGLTTGVLGPRSGPLTAASRLAIELPGQGYLNARLPNFDCLFACMEATLRGIGLVRFLRWSREERWEGDGRQLNGEGWLELLVARAGPLDGIRPFSHAAPRVKTTKHYTAHPTNCQHQT